MAIKFAKKIWSRYQIWKLDNQIKEVISSVQESRTELSPEEIDTALDRIGKLTELKKKRQSSL